jgi:uncharacterized protein (DUF4213/DUF364 family)
MTRSKLLTTLALLALAAVGVAVLSSRWRAQRELADETVIDIEDKIANLDPVTRAAVVGKLGADAAHAAHSQVE